jgi:hypothetical protein
MDQPQDFLHDLTLRCVGKKDKEVSQLCREPIHHMRRSTGGESRIGARRAID